MKFAQKLQQLRQLDFNTWKTDPHTTGLDPKILCANVWKEMDVIADIGLTFDPHFKNSEHAKRLLQLWFATYETIQKIDNDAVRTGEGDGL